MDVKNTATKWLSMIALLAIFVFVVMRAISVFNSEVPLHVKQSVPAPPDASVLQKGSTPGGEDDPHNHRIDGPSTAPLPSDKPLDTLKAGYDGFVPMPSTGLAFKFERMDTLPRPGYPTQLLFYVTVKNQSANAIDYVDLPGINVTLDNGSGEDPKPAKDESPSASRFLGRGELSLPPGSQSTVPFMATDFGASGDVHVTAVEVSNLGRIPIPPQ